MAERMIVALDVGGTNLRGALVDARGRLSHRRSVRTRADAPAREVLNQMVEAVEALAGREHRIAGVAVAIAGFLDLKRTTVLHSPNFPAWRRVGLHAHLQRRFKPPLRIENDANAALLGERWRGALAGIDDAMLITLGTGVGGALCCGGELRAGTHGGAGEFGHLTVDPRGPRCGCGNRGCLEAWIGARGIERRTGKSLSRLNDDAGRGDPRAIREFHDLGVRLGIALASLGFAFDPEVIALGGKVARAYRHFAPAARAEMRRRLGRHPARAARLVRCRLGDDAGLVGAASLFTVNACR
jgi:glucokinase